MIDLTPDSMQTPAVPGFAVLPRMVDNAVLIDIRKDGALFGVVTSPVVLGVSGFYTGIHASKEAFAEMLQKAYEMGRADALQAPKDNA